MATPYEKLDLGFNNQHENNIRISLNSEKGFINSKSSTGGTKNSFNQLKNNQNSFSRQSTISKRHNIDSMQVNKHTGYPQNFGNSGKISWTN